MKSDKNTKKEKICFYVFGFPPDFSGATLQTLYFSKLLKQKSLEYFFLTPTFDTKNIKNNSHEGVRVIRFLRTRSQTLLSYHYKLIFHLFKNRNDFTSLYINGNDGQFWTIFWAVVFAKLFFKKIFVELNMAVQGVDPLSIIGTKFEGLKLFLAKRVNKFSSNSLAITKHFKKSYPDLGNIETIFYGIDVDRFQKEESFKNKMALRARLGLPLECRIAMTCGAISKRKGFDFLLACWKTICARYNEDCTLVIAGPCKDFEGCDEHFVEKILKLTNDPLLKGKVVLTGQVDNIDEYMKASDLFLFSSRQEGSPSVIREAMSSSLPVVSLNLPDITEELIDHNASGMIIYLKDYQNLANFEFEEINDSKAKQDFIDATLKILENPGFAGLIGDKAREKILNNYTFEVKFDKFSKMLALS